MNLFLNPYFWLAAGGAYLLLQVELPVRRTARFGLLNAGALAVLLGWPVALFALVLAAAVWGCAWGLRSLKERGRARNMAVALVGVALTMGWLFLAHKLYKQHSSTLAYLVGSSGLLGARLLPVLSALSFSYVALRAVDFLRSTVADGQPLLDPLSAAGYLFPFHMLPAGPINVYRDHVEMDSAPAPTLTASRLLRCASLVATGLLYKLVIADSLWTYAYGLGGRVHSDGWLDWAFLLVYVFFDFAGYSLVALGIGSLLGVATPVNFRKPFLSVSITEFWTRWHISLGAFVRRNIFTPLQLRLVRAMGVRRAVAAGLLTLTISFVFVGLWHRLSWRFLAWGFALGAVMAVEKLVQNRARRGGWMRRPAVQWAVRVLGPVYVFAAMAAMTGLTVSEVF